MDRVAARVADRKTTLAAIVQIDVVHSGSGDGNQFEFWQAGKFRFAKEQFVANRDGGILKTFDDIGGTRLAIINPFVIEVRPAKVGPESVPLQEYDPFHD